MAIVTTITTTVVQIVIIIIVATTTTIIVITITTAMIPIHHNVSEAENLNRTIYTLIMIKVANRREEKR